jgi:hypothetical protein
MELYLYYPTRLHYMVLNELRTNRVLSFTLPMQILPRALISDVVSQSS